MTPDLKAMEHCCEEFSPLSHGFYIPCNRPAVHMVKNADPTPYRMCALCAIANTRLGGKILGRYTRQPPPNATIHQIKGRR